MKKCFPFPYPQPYPQQIQLMNQIYDTVVSGSIGLFESPTGTGKSLSLICSILYWLEEEENKIINDLVISQKSSDTDWIDNFCMSSRIPPHTQVALEKYKQLRENITKLNIQSGSKSTLEDDPLSLDDHSSLDIRDLKLPQIIYCSRTHSQISQFIHEIRRTCYSSIRCISLASRAHMCINTSINSSKSDYTVSELCLELQRNNVRSSEEIDLAEQPYKRSRSKRATNSCPFHCSFRETQFVRHAFGRIRDIEELVELGSQVQGCPYYGSREAIKVAQVICLPYSLILNKDQRESLGICLEGNVVIFDEAHNIVDAANSTHSAEISTTQLRMVATILDNYSNRFRSVLTGKNLYNLQVLANIVNSLLENIVRLVVKDSLDSNYHSLVMNSNDFLFRFGLDNINLLQLCRYAKDNNLVNKFSKAFQTNREDATHFDEILSQNSLRAFFQFLQTLCNRDSDGRILFFAEPPEFINFRIQFALINPSNHFRELIDQTRSVIFLGGTLKPFSLISSQLFPHLSSPSSQSKKSIVEFSCDHIVSSTHVTATIVTHGSSTCPLNFRYSTRESPTLLGDLLSIICDICRTISYGVVIFFPSYGYLDYVINNWQSNFRTLYQQLLLLKPIFIDSRSDTLDIWNQYSDAAVSSPRGACLLSIVGGRLSEGINFSDNLARCVAIVGLPYPDRNDPLLKEKLKWSEENNPGSGKCLYDSLCMRAVNQSIGRSIRHANDYASIVLLDARYSQRRILELLPSWISKNVTVTNDPSMMRNFLQDFASQFQQSLF